MIAPDSLAAFSASSSSGVSSLRGTQPPAPLRVAANPAPRPKAAVPAAPPGVTPGQVLPRGSLLDLRV